MEGGPNHTRLTAQILPWDDDIDVQMTLDTMAFLANYYQLYVFHYNQPDIPGGRDYMLEINPDYYRETKWDKLNSIDARWIDMQTGLFIDITAVRPNITARAEGQPYALMCKDLHKYNETDLFPLRDSIFEGINVKIPFEYTWLLEEEYTKMVLTRDVWEGHKFNRTTLEWESIRGKKTRLPNTRVGRPKVVGRDLEAADEE
jgi:LicD family